MYIFKGLASTTLLDFISTSSFGDSNRTPGTRASFIGFDKDRRTLNWRHARPREFAMQKKGIRVPGRECLETPTPLSLLHFNI